MDWKDERAAAALARFLVRSAVLEARFRMGKLSVNGFDDLLGDLALDLIDGLCVVSPALDRSLGALMGAVRVVENQHGGQWPEGVD